MGKKRWQFQFESGSSPKISELLAVLTFEKLLV